jgi:sugar/nucleoside kinase (ribokinase family)
MARILVAGLVNVETTLRVDDFPLPYTPVHYAFDRIHSSVSGVGFNVALALRTLGHEVRFLTLLGRDAAGDLAGHELIRRGLHGLGVLHTLKETAQSVILYDGTGRREIQVDLKNIQEQSFPAEVFRPLLEGCDLAVLCNINFTRAMLAPTRAAGIPIATDVHTLRDLEDAYNRDYLEHAALLFMSGDALPEPPPAWARRVLARYHPQALVIGAGREGAWLHTPAQADPELIPAVTVRPVVNTIGAGDALFSAFLHGYLETREARAALRQAVVFAGYKIGETSAAAGFLDAAALQTLAANYL